MLLLIKTFLSAFIVCVRVGMQKYGLTNGIANKRHKIHNCFIQNIRKMLISLQQSAPTWERQVRNNSLVFNQNVFNLEIMGKVFYIRNLDKVGLVWNGR